MNIKWYEFAAGEKYSGYPFRTDFINKSGK